MLLDGFLTREGLAELITLLGEHYRCIGPQINEGTISYREVQGLDTLRGYHDQQSPGRYRLETSSSPRLFAWANGAQAIKPWLFPPREVLWQSQQDEQGRLKFHEPQAQAEALAIIGVRACDLAALQIHDQHFLDNGKRDEAYQRRREKLFLVAVNCSHPAATCFCASTGDGPSAEQGFDLVLDELDEGYVIRSGTESGAAYLRRLALQPITDEQRKTVMVQQQAAIARQERSLPGRDLQAALFARLDQPDWQQVGEQCLACGNCTSVCPTCFCYSELDAPQLDGRSADHLRQWDSCFAEGHSYIHGWTIRAQTAQRYRQWMTHKLGSWHEQYGRSGCVGCGRCITWCPVGIDFTRVATQLCHEGEAQ